MAEFTWGDTVLVSPDAAKNFNPNEKGSVVGFREVPDSRTGSQITVCTVEFSDGTDIEIPESLLIRIDELSDS